MTEHSMREAIRDALGAHGGWKLKLRTAAQTGRSAMSVAEASCDDRCQFGRWLYGPTLDDRTRAGKPYQVVRRLHAEFHQSAGQVLDAALRGQKDRAEGLMAAEFEPRSETLKRALMKWMGEISRG